MSAPTHQQKKIRPEEVTVAIFVALSCEAIAVVLSFDEEFQCRTEGGKYTYRFGRIGEHYVVVAQPNEKGKVNASNIAAHVTFQFPNVRLALMVGIGGGIPSDEKDIRLGDVAVSKPEDGLPGVLQYDFVKAVGDGNVVLKGTLNKPHASLLSAVNYVEGQEIMEQSPLPQSLDFIIRKSESFKHPGKADVLYDPTFRHVGGKDCSACEDCSSKKIVQRLPRRQKGPQVFRGLILSGDSVVKDPYERLRLCRGYDKALCFEMEAAGIMDENPCLVVRGICDYCDTHKQDDWHYYASAVAAAYARIILLHIPGQQVKHLEHMGETLKKDPEESPDIDQERRRTSQEALEWQKCNDLLPIQYDALHDSDAVSQHAPLCYDGTRKSILNKIADWANDVEGETFFLLHGPAGTGKSTIARSIANQLVTNPTATTRLGASYFFITPSPKRFFPTIAARLLHSIPQLTRHLWNSLEGCGWLSKAEIEGKDCEQQLETLILNPVRSLSQQSSDKWSRTIVVDALDKCEKGYIPTICTQLSRLHGLDSVRLRIFLTSRSHGTIVQIFKDFEENRITRSLSMLKYPSETSVDIAKVLEANFAGIRKRRNIEEGWPAPTDLHHLVNLATRPSPLFIYAATVCRYVDNVMVSTNPVSRLKRWLNTVKSASKLDQQFNHMYKKVLDEAEDGLDGHEKQLLWDALRSILLLFTPLSSKCLEALLGKNDGDVDYLLPNLHAVLDIQHGGPVKILHESFRDCLLDQEGIFRVDALETHMMLTRNCVDRMKRNSKGPTHGLHRDMYGDGDYSTTTNDIGHAINNFIPPDLEYACLNWVNHLQSFQQDLGQIIDKDRSAAFLQEMPALLKDVKTLLNEHFLHWIETLSLLGRLSDGISSIKQLQSILLSRYDAASNFDAFLRDAERFALSYGFMIERFPLQTYGAALTFCPTDSQVNRRLGVERYPDIPTLRGARIGWDHCLYTLKGHGGSVNAVASSSSRKILASASSDRTVRLWDDVTGAHKRTLQGHRGYVLDIAFSPDGNTLASASSDCQVWVWGVHEGNHIRTLEGHGNWVNSVVFLSNSILASASSDWTINLWDIDHGICKAVFKSHSGSVNALAYSRNGKVLASGSSDRTVRIWNTAERTPIKKSLDHDGSVTAVSFAPDGRFLASASSDKAVRLWDPDKASQIRLLEFHGDWVNSVTFINDGKLAIASSDRTLRLWNINTKNMQKFEGLVGWFNSTAFLADRNVLVAASSDRTLRMWDGIMGGSEQMREGHDGPVNAVAFSPDGTWLASASSDWTVRIWNVEEGTCVKTLQHQNHTTEDQQTIEDHSRYILSIAFSPDVKILALGSSDWRVRLWDVDEGTLIKTLAYRNHIIRDERTTEDHSRYVLSIAFSPNGKIIASGSSDWRVRLWSIDKSVPLTTLEGHRSWVRAVAFSTDGKLLASASTDGMLCLWNFDKRNNKTSIYEDSASSILRERCCDADKRTHNQDWVRAIAFSPDGKVLASTLTDGTVSLLDLNKVNSIRTHEFLAVVFSLDVFNGADYVYAKLANYLKNYLEQVIDETKTHTGEGLLTFYNREWPRYTEAAKYINHMFQSLERFVGRAIEEGTTGIYDVYTLHLVQWRSVVIGSISEKIMEVVLGLVERKRNGEIIENGIIKRVVESFVLLDIDHDDPLTTYRYYFETPFLEATRLYYRTESKHYLAKNSVGEYMRRAELRLDEEDELVRACLHHNTADPLRQICIQVLIAENSEILRNNFQSLLDAGREEDMARTVNLLSRMPDGLAPLLSKFETHLRKAGLAAVINAASAAEKLESKIYVGPVSVQYHDLVRWALSGDDHRTRSSDNICRELISQLDVCKWGSDKFPEPLSKYNAKPTEAEGSADVISITEDWIARDGRNILCLPPDYRATCAARWNNILVLGHRSGLVSFSQLP
ncbi:hypothetical protein MANI_114843 [Metarhizium anisopliae]|nr:hypothetical protein MANI_114843 [Metarhizium anisopliae]